MLAMYAILSFKIKAIPSEIPGVQADLIYLIMVCLIILSCGITSTSVSSISLEAKTLWILRSIPVDIKTVFKAKALTNIIIQLPVAVIAIAVICIVIGFSLVQSLLLFAIAVVVLLAASYAGLVVNLLVPKLNWQNETQVIKQSAAAGLYVLFSVVSCTVCVVLAVLGMLFLHLDSVTLAIGLLSLYLLQFAVYRGLAMTWGVRKFQKIY